MTVVAFLLGVALLAAFLCTSAGRRSRSSRSSSWPAAPAALPTSARGLVYAGFYGLFFFLAQFLQDVQGYSPLRAGLAFLPMPLAVFLSRSSPPGCWRTACPRR